MSEQVEVECFIGDFPQSPIAFVFKENDGTMRASVAVYCHDENDALLVYMSGHEQNHARPTISRINLNDLPSVVASGFALESTGSTHAAQFASTLETRIETQQDTAAQLAGALGAKGGDGAALVPQDWLDGLKQQLQGIGA